MSPLTRRRSTLFKLLPLLGGILPFLLLTSCNSALQPQRPGDVIRIDNFESAFVPKRHIEVYLPYRYAPKEKTYPVIYIHDGQNVFNPKTSFKGVDWGVDETLDTLIYEAKVEPVIVVAVWNSDFRRNEYMPEDPLPPYDSLGVDSTYREFFADTSVFSNNYLKFMVEELKPYIDDHYATRPEAENTSIMGSSMGGLISLYALCKYPEVFGKAACVSTHWPAFDGVTVDYFGKELPAPGKHKIYFDHGTETLDADYGPYQKRMDGQMEKRGYQKGKDWETKVFEGAAHDEASWKERVEVHLQFLLDPPQ